MPKKQALTHLQHITSGVGVAVRLDAKPHPAEVDHHTACAYVYATAELPVWDCAQVAVSASALPYFVQRDALLLC